MTYEQLEAELKKQQAAREATQKSHAAPAARRASPDRATRQTIRQRTDETGCFNLLVNKLESTAEGYPDADEVERFVEQEYQARAYWRGKQSAQADSQASENKKAAGGTAVTAAEREPGQVDVDSISGDSTPDEVEAYRQSIISIPAAIAAEALLSALRESTDERRQSEDNRLGEAVCRPGR